MGTERIFHCQASVHLDIPVHCSDVPWKPPPLWTQENSMAHHDSLVYSIDYTCTGCIFHCLTSAHFDIPILCSNIGQHRITKSQIRAIAGLKKKRHPQSPCQLCPFSLFKKKKKSVRYDQVGQGKHQHNSIHCPCWVSSAYEKLFWPVFFQTTRKLPALVICLLCASFVPANYAISHNSILCSRYVLCVCDTHAYTCCVWHTCTHTHSHEHKHTHIERDRNREQFFFSFTYISCLFSKHCEVPCLFHLQKVLLTLFISFYAHGYNKVYENNVTFAPQCSIPNTTLL